MKLKGFDIYSPANLLEQTVNEWKHQEKIDHEIRICELTLSPTNNAECKLELSIIAAIMVDWKIENIIVKAEPFYVKALAHSPADSGSLAECINLKRVMKEIDDEFKHIFKMKKG